MYNVGGIHMTIEGTIKMIEEVEKEYNKVSALDWLKEKLSANALKKELDIVSLSNVMVGSRCVDKGSVIGYETKSGDIVDVNFLASWCVEDKREPRKEDFVPLLDDDRMESFAPITK